MPASADPGPDTLVDTSVAVPLVVADHEAHDDTFAALGTRRLGLAGHAAFETFSVLTRLPSPARRTPPATVRVMDAMFPATRFLSARASQRLLAGLSGSGIAGGSIYDALVGATAAEHGCVLVTRDRRALEVYRALDVRVELLT